MELNGGLAFGAALAGGALFGPMGAFMALPVAALIVSFTSHYRRGHEVVYESGTAAQPRGRRTGRQRPGVHPRSEQARSWGCAARGLAR
jgi:hypothetical protein